MSITFIAPAYQEKRSNRPLIESLLNQCNVNWRLCVYHNGPNQEMKDWANSYNDPRVLYVESESNTGSWGCYNRINALNNIVDTEYVIQTSIQDYYTPITVQSIMNCYGNDLIYFNCLHNHYNFDILSSELKDCRIDWGSFCIKTNLAKKIGINYPEKGNADGLFIEECLKSSILNTIYKIDKILTVHN